MRLNADIITGMIGGYCFEELENSLIPKIRDLDKLVDELSKGRSMDKRLRK